jgi:hypothetical protein
MSLEKKYDDLADEFYGRDKEPERKVIKQMSCQEDMKLAKEFIAKRLNEYRAVKHALTHVMAEQDEIPEVVEYVKIMATQVVMCERIEYFLKRNNVLLEDMPQDDDPELGT